MYNLLHLFRFPLTRYKSWTLHSYLSFYEMSIVCVKRAVFWTPIGIEFVFENSTDMLLYEYDWAHMCRRTSFNWG